MNMAQRLVAAGAAAILLAAGSSRGQSLETCIEEALRYNPDRAAALAAIRAAEAGRDMARAAWWPRLTLSASYTRTDNPPQAFMMALNQRRLAMADPAFDPNAPDDTANIRFGAGAQWLLYDGGRRRLGADMARLNAEAAADLERAASNALILEVIRAYHGALQARAFAAVRRENVAGIEESLRVARERFEAGSAVKTDLLNLEVLLAEAREDLIRAGHAVRLAVAGLNTVIGSPLVPEDGPPEPAPAALPPLPDEPAGADVEQRPELQAARRQAETAERAWREARRHWQPSVAAFGSYDRDGEEAGDTEGSYLAGVALEWDAFTGGERPALVRRRHAEWQAALQRTRGLRDALALDLERSRLSVHEARERIDVTAKSVESAAEALRITRGRYEQGAADITELLNAQVALTAIRTRDVAARYDYLTALADLERARGVLVDTYGDRMP